MDDVQVILNLRDAWRYMLEHVHEPFTLDEACKMNEFVSRNESLEPIKTFLFEKCLFGLEYS